ncbi:hypothetical protein H0H81_006303 [Sphagnurus paluster]|uniref:Decapping nuclease n=1 Tax=Sphagnurus paluster TaxID=117069 RepID=A0A9P7FX99_9AGAR|nr:hypothetical protein H0H81_006303 [Sphagnurus paluster]
MSKRSLSSYTNDGDGHGTDAHSTGESSQPPRRPRLDYDDSAITPSSSTRAQTLTFPNISKPASKPTPFQQPTQILSFSYTPSRTLEFSDSALRYFVEPPLGANLGYGYEQWIRKPDERGRIDGLLQAFSKAKGLPGVALHDVGVVAWRGVMTRYADSSQVYDALADALFDRVRILTSPYEEREGWDLNVMFVNGTMYFEEHLSEERLKEKNEMEPRHRLQTYYGYAFESYCTSETPNRKASTRPGDPIGWGGDVDTNVQWCSVVRTKLGNTRLLIGGEVDCVRGKHTHQTDTFVELKTSLVIRGRHDESKFENHSFSEFPWEIVVGFRTPAGVVTTTQSFKTIEIPRLVRGKPGAWDPLICLEWGNTFLTFLKDVVSRRAIPDAAVWRVKFRPREGVSVEVLDATGVEDVQGGEDRTGFLPTWYWDELHAKRSVEETPLALDREDKATPPSMVVNAGWQI